MTGIIVAEHEHEDERSAGQKVNKTAGQPSAQLFKQPYPPSWIDRLDDRVQELPFPAWFFYLGVALVLVLARTIAAWSDGSVPVGTFFPAHVLIACTGAYLLFVLHCLDDRAGAALSDFRPVLALDDMDADYERLRYQLTSMPARPTLILSLAGLVWGIALPTFLLPAAQNRLTRQFTSPAASVIDYVLIGLTWVIGFVVVYHTIRQLGLISRIYTQHTKVSIFDTGPLYALSRVAAMTTVALLFLAFAYVPLAANWQLDNPVIALTVGVPIPVALATFVWPLFGAHRLLQEEKTRWKSEVARRMEAVSLELLRRTEAGDYTEMGQMNNAIDSLVKEQGLLSKVSTWPWEPEAVRGVVTALLLPVILWSITRVLERLGF